MSSRELRRRMTVAQALRAFWQAYLEGMLRDTRGNICEAARRADVSADTIYRMMRRYDVKNPFVNGKELKIDTTTGGSSHG